MKKIILLILFLTLIGSLFLKNKKVEPITQKEVGCETKMVAISENLDLFDGSPKPVDFSDFPEAKTYYTRITETVKKGVNFAGYYSLIPFGVGTDNVGFVVVNLKTGKVIAYNPVSTNYHLQNYGSYFVLVPVYAGQTKEYYKIVNDKLEMVCSEVSSEDMYSNSPDNIRP